VGDNEFRGADGVRHRTMPQEEENYFTLADEPEQPAATTGSGRRQPASR
jgi:hypothetical protein